MNPQFFPPLQVRPKLVPVIVRPTVPVAFASFTQPHVNTSPVQHGNTLFTFGVSPDVILDSPTTAKTRRELEQLGSTERATELIFELAARKNGIRIGVDPGSKAATVGKVKQDDPLEDFKKIAERNGITVCPPGSKVRKDSDSTCTHRTATPPTDDLANRDGEWMSTSTSRNVSPWECSSPSSVGNYYELANKEDNVTCSEGNVLTENVIKSSTSDTLDLFKNKVTASGIKFQDITGLNEGREPALTQSGENLAQSSETSMEMTNLHGTAKSDNVAANLEHAPDTETLDKVDTDLIQFINKNDADVEDTRPEQEMSTEKIESKSNLKKHEEWAFRTEIVKEMRVENSKEGAVNDRGTCATNENSPNTEHISSLKEEDVQIAAFQEIARRKGIKVGNSSYQTCLATSSNAEKVVENIEADCSDILDFTEDVQIAKFQEMAWLNGIKVGGKRLKSRSCSESSESFKRKALESRSHSESSESFTTGTAQETECWAGAAYPYEEDNQIVRFQEIARLKGIRVTQTGILSNSSSCSSLSLANSDDHLHYSGEESCPVVTPTYTTGDKFEELAKRNGIKIGKSVAPSGSLNVVGPSGDNMLKVQHGSETCSSFKSPERVAVVFCESSTQTEVPTADCFSQTCEKDLGLFKQSTGVQVDSVKEAFEEEFTQWKLDDNAAGDSEELCYRELYFTERNAREALKDSLQNEKDVSAYTKHNHKRVMEQLKEELNSKTEEIEKLKKDLKTLKKHKETEAKRITKELKSKEEELESTKSTLQLKEAAIEGLTSIVKDQSEKLKGLEDQLEELKTVLSNVNKNTECSTCVTHSKGHSPDKADLKEQSGDGWTVFTGRKSRSPSFNPTNGIKAAGSPSPGRADELCDIQEMCPPSSFRQGNGDATRQYNGDPTKQALNIIQLASPENGETLVQETASVVQESAMQEVILTSAPQDSSYSVLQNAESSKSLLVNNSLSSHVSPKAGSGNEVHETEQSPQAEEHLPAENSSASGWGNPLLHNVLNMDDKVPNIDALTNTTVPSCTGQQPLQPFFPVQPFPFRGIPAHVVAQYLASLVVQPNIPPENRLPNSSAPLRPPPGLNTEPVPEEEPEQLSPSTHPPGKSSSFDKLMEALRKRFPNKSRQELILDLKKAKAASGAAGFRGKQIPDVVKCVEEVTVEKPDLQIDN